MRRWGGPFLRSATRSTVKSPTSSSTPAEALAARPRAKSRRLRTEPALRELRVELGSRAYPIRIGPRLLGNPASFAELRGRVLRIVTDSNVAPRYLAAATEALGVGAAEARV